MTRIKCTIPGASDLIDGVEFFDRDGAKVSVEVSREVAAQFVRVDGFEIINDADTEPLPGLDEVEAEEKKTRPRLKK